MNRDDRSKNDNFLAILAHFDVIMTSWIMSNVFESGKYILALCVTSTFVFFMFSFDIIDKIVSNA